MSYVKTHNLNNRFFLRYPDCKVCFVRREYSVIALFMRRRSLRGYAEHGVDG